VDGSFAAGTSPQFTVFGITVNASSATLRGAGGATLTLADFLTQAVGHSVKVSGQLSGTIVTASEARIHARLCWQRLSERSHNSVTTARSKMLATRTARVAVRGFVR